MKRLLRKILFGITLQQEYLCVRANEFVKALKVIAYDNSFKYKVDITSNLLFVGYKPLTLAVDSRYLNEIKVNRHENLHLSFYTQENKELAKLIVKLINQVNFNSVISLIFEGVKGLHSFSNNFHKLLNFIYYKTTGNRNKNIYLSGNLYDQVKIAYSIPRQIYLASVGLNGVYNIFPTDLSGHLDEEIFIMSLRCGGKANDQVEKAGKCLIAKMDGDYYSEVYGAGKNHMREFTSKNNLGIRLMEESSAILNLPIPLGAMQYFELEKIDKFMIGIHVIHFFRIINSVRLRNSLSFLMHIHREYAEWRVKNGINTNYLIRK